MRFRVYYLIVVCLLLGASGVFVHADVVPQFSSYLSGEVSVDRNNLTLIKMDTEVVDTASNYSPSSGRFTASVPGLYLFSFSAYCWDGPYNEGYQQEFLRKNGTNIAFSGVYIYSGTVSNTPVTAFLNLAAGDYIEPYVLCQTDYVAGGQVNTSFSGTLIASSSSSSGSSVSSSASSTSILGTVQVDIPLLNYAFCFFLFFVSVFVFFMVFRR